MIVAHVFYCMKYLNYKLCSNRSAVNNGLIGYKHIIIYLDSALYLDTSLKLPW